MTAPHARPEATHQQRIFLRHSFPQSGTAASGTITADTNANMADGDRLVIGDGFRSPLTYEYDKGGNGVTAGNVTWPPGTTAATVASNLRTAILANQPALLVVDQGNGTLTITNRWVGAGGNVAITKVSSSALAVTGMSGGADPGGVTLADTTFKLEKVKVLAQRVTRAMLLLPLGLAADAANFCTFKLLRGATTVIASWSTNTTSNGGQGTVPPNTPVEMALSATVDLDDGDDLSLFLDVTGAPAVPPGLIQVEGFEL